MQALKRRQPKRSNDKKSSSAKSHSWLLLTVPIIIAIAAEVFLQPGLMFHLSMLAIFGWTSITEYFKQKKESRPIMKLLVPAVIAVIAYLVGGSIEKYHENKSKPIFAIETNTIETNMGNRQVDINVKICTGRMSSFTINYPVQGMVTRIEPHNPLTEVQKTHFQVRGSTDGISLNNVEIISEGIKANVNLQYTIYYKPMPVPSHIVIPERDTYTITYTWKYKGKEDSNTEWYFIKNDQKTGKPWVELTDFTHVTTQEGKWSTSFRVRFNDPDRPNF